MKKQIEICYSNSMKINKGQYEQEAPFYSAKTVINVNSAPIDEVAEYNRLRAIIDPLLKAQYEATKADLAGIRVRILNGIKCPGVTSILHPDPLPIDGDYALRGSEIHRLCNHFIETANWETPQVPLKKITYEEIKYQKFFNDFNTEIDFIGCKKNIEVFNKKYVYSGEIDIICKVLNRVTLVDIKCGAWDWTQLMAYWKCGVECDQLAIFDLKKEKLEVLDPTSDEAIEKWEKFLIKRGEFKARFGL